MFYVDWGFGLDLYHREPLSTAQAYQISWEPSSARANNLYYNLLDNCKNINMRKVNVCLETHLSFSI